MTVTGIIAEFNPFHNGHRHLLEKSQGLTIVAISGNFVQRGEPALIDKWTRAQMALENGADLVVELPFLVAVQSADYFARGGIDILAKLGIEQVVFGTEEMIDYQQLSQIYAQKSQEMEAYLATLPASLTYPQKMQKMWENFAGVKFTGATPNHILGLAYAKAAAKRGLTLKPIQRLGAGYHSTSKSEQIASATAIRQHLADQDFLAQTVPNLQILERASKVVWADYFPLLKYQILTNPDLTKIFQVNEELASRISSAIKEVTGLDELVELVATKRYTKARIRRVLTYILVQAQESPLPQAIHVLGFNQKGQDHLKTIKSQVQLVSRIGKEPWDSQSQKADAVYQLGNSAIKEQNWGRVPVRIEEEN